MRISPHSGLCLIHDPSIDIKTYIAGICTAAEWLAKLGHYTADADIVNSIIMNFHLSWKGILLSITVHCTNLTLPELKGILWDGHSLPAMKRLLGSKDINPSGPTKSAHLESGERKGNERKSKKSYCIREPSLAFNSASESSENGCPHY